MEQEQRVKRRILPVKRSRLLRRIRIFFRTIKHKPAVLAAIAVAAGAIVFGIIYSAAQDPLPAWKPGAVKSEIIAFIKNSDDILTGGYIPEEDRIAVIDFDGTLLNENPLNLELSVLKYRVENDQWMDSEQVQALNDVISDSYRETKSDSYSENYKNVITKAFYGMSGKELGSYVERFMDRQNPEINDKKYNELFYRPIIELIDYLKKNKYEVYIITSGQRDIARAAAQQLDIVDTDHILGLDSAYYPNVSGASSNTFIPGDEAVRGWAQAYMGTSDFKVEKIVQQIGKRPVLAAGNSLEDFSLLNYTVSNPDYNSLALLILHDDNNREIAYAVEEHPLWRLNAEQNKWQIVSVAEDFKTIFR